MPSQIYVIKSYLLIFPIQIVNKLNVELVYARDELQRALKSEGDVNRARKRVGWLEDRMENLLGRRRMRVSVGTSFHFFYELHSKYTIRVFCLFIHFLRNKC